ncbi:MAG TPA: hypothetical protein PLS83_00300 [Methanothrix soehngenii]|nr:hypothetical protein [Methanothrix soehngenii]
MSQSKDRLYDLLPAVYRQRDADQGYPLKALLEVISDQVKVVEDDITGLYENWFIETCQDWAVPYLGDLIGYRPVSHAGGPGDATTPEGIELNRILFPRSEIANTIRYRRRKGTLALLEELAKSASGWPARAVEFYRLLRVAQHINHQHLDRGKTVDMRSGDALERLGGPFDELAHTVDVRRIKSHRTRGRHNIPSVGVFVWRLKSYPITQAPAYYMDRDLNHFTFSVLGLDTNLFTKPVEEPNPVHIADETNVPTIIRRRAFEERMEDFYGEGKSLCIWRADLDHPIPIENIIAADLSDWSYAPLGDGVAVDPELGRIALSSSFSQENSDAGIWVSYHYGFSADMGGGEYPRKLRRTTGREIYRVGPFESFQKIGDALNQWNDDKIEDGKKRDAIIEIEDSGAYAEKIKITLESGDRLELRAANGKRPVIRLLNWETNRPDSLKIIGTGGDGGPASIVLDGLVVTGRGVKVTGELTEVKIRHCTLVPGWMQEDERQLHKSAAPSLRLKNTTARLSIESSILGPVLINQDEVQTDPLSVSITDSILDATGPEKKALDASGCPVAFAKLTVLRSTIYGETQVNSIDLAENCIFFGKVTVCRRQEGCMRFCYLGPGSRTPRRYNCQPDLVEHAAEEEIRIDAGGLGSALSTLSDVELKEEIKAAKERERRRVVPQFNSTHYGRHDYFQLADSCAEEIKRGADDQSEMGAFHDLYQPHREANLLTRIEEYTPAGADVGIIFVNFLEEKYERRV